MKILYLGQELEAEFEYDRTNDYIEEWHKQALVIYNVQYPDYRAEWGINYRSGFPVPWTSLYRAIVVNILSNEGDIPQKRKAGRKLGIIAKYLTGNANGASAGSFRAAVKQAIKGCTNG